MTNKLKKDFVKALKQNNVKQANRIRKAIERNELLKVNLIYDIRPPKINNSLTNIVNLIVN